VVIGRISPIAAVMMKTRNGSRFSNAATRRFFINSKSLAGINQEKPRLASIWREPASRWSVSLIAVAIVPQRHERIQKMNWNQVEGNWEQFKGNVQKQWGKLTGDDLDVIDGNRKQLAGKLQERYGKAQEEAEREIDAWLTRH
jgi:uncharacterized protein YjbJ (UPF0337 family)